MLINQLDSKQIKHYLLRDECYAAFDLPPYFDFQSVLKQVSKKIGSGLYTSFQKDSPKNYESVNYSLMSNKNGKYDWRPLQLIHPVLYVSLVNLIARESNWELIKSRFDHFSNNNCVECKSLQTIPQMGKSDVGAQIRSWIVEVEQTSIALSLDFELLCHTDITNCYGSIYSHSIPWALHSKDDCKKNLRKSSPEKLLGDDIDKHLRAMSYGQTNGIPQGSILMDLIAELVLGYADELLTQKIRSDNICELDFKIIRYRDDYRIFSNDSQLTDKIVRLLSDVLTSLGLKLNSKKTSVCQTVITGSVKEDKLYWLQNRKELSSLHDQIQLLHAFSEKFPNSGTLQKELDNISKNTNGEEFSKKTRVTISLVVDIAYKNPRTFEVCAFLLSKLLDCMSDECKTEIIPRIIKKFQKIPNRGLLDIWLQRIFIKTKFCPEFDERICKLVSGKLNSIWESGWLKDEMQAIIRDNSIFDREVASTIPKVVEWGEINLFGADSYF